MKSDSELIGIKFEQIENAWGTKHIRILFSFTDQDFYYATISPIIAEEFLITLEDIKQYIKDEINDEE